MKISKILRSDRMLWRYQRCYAQTGCYEDFPDVTLRPYAMKISQMLRSDRMLWRYLRCYAQTRCYGDISDVTLRRSSPFLIRKLWLTKSGRHGAMLGNGLYTSAALPSLSTLVTEVIYIEYTHTSANSTQEEVIYIHECHIKAQTRFVWQSLYVNILCSLIVICDEKFPPL